MTKNEVRQEIKGKKEKLTKEQIAAKSEIITKYFTALTEYRNCSQIILYAAFNQEVNTLPLINQALKDGKKVALPKVMGKDIEFFYIESFNDTGISSLGIPEPDIQNKIELLTDTVNVILVPGLAFDMEGNRIGYGKSYYDAYFAAHKAEFLKIAFAYDFQVYESIPREPHDVKIDFIITDTFSKSFSS
ncbi:5-formyltetrahydrofolate cyclo-ligase [Anaerocolumna xylanovorans]|uniref:5-formyltetrahydrofolate cyclo-ligase n=1 Tax=Anaerocolumna xylanovorans DSM 12503 TaxID=1121345 RepID=A0A1M7YCE0_9FIRM|nr:5-formyltetrahydrofolate cyclo-ligase [Anaerocolumna xylanovorans]SHO50178.1 5-formyltetrahydrofolate cyclo-ligase [Anaerocolumna xylanovorans DSM 12503]